LIGIAVNISKQLHGWLESLKNSEIKGVKFLNNVERNRYEREKARNKEFEDFDQQMADFKARHEDWLRRRQTDPTATLQ